MTTFVEERFPLGIAIGASGGPQWRTDIVSLASGAETRNARWAGSRRRYDAGSGIRSLSDLQSVSAFFERMRGRLTGFRFRDPFDHASAPPGGDPAPLDVELGAGDGVRSDFKLIKIYGIGDTIYERRIAKPVAGSVRVAVDGLELIENIDFECEFSSGVIRFLAAPPVAGHRVTAGFRFDVPVRFDVDRLDMSLTHMRAGQVPTIPLIEIDPLTETVSQ